MILFVIGLIGYQANFIQFGLDQLLEASSEYLGLFVHWAVWVKNVVSIITIVVCSVIFTCNTFEHLFHGIKIQYEIIFFVLLSYWNLYFFLFCNNFEFLQISLVLC